jgi:hydrophobic/amphiphilic exporter-1 (mainly G- bacteria), HAE1 family
MGKITDTFSLAALSIKRPVTVIMLAVSVIVLGLFSARLLKLEFLPELDAPFILVSVPYPGASPKEVERDIIRPIEGALSTISGMKNVWSTANENGANFFMLFDFNKNLKIKVAEVRERVDAVKSELPRDVQRVFVRKFSTNDQPALVVRLSSSTRDLSRDYALLERVLKRPLERIEGVASVDIAGVEPNEVEIALLPERVAAYSVDLNQLAQTLAAANFSVSAGLINDGTQRFRVQPIGELSSLEQLGELSVTPAGVKLRDIAEIRLKAQKTDAIRILNGRYAVGLDIQRERSANLVDVCERAMAEIARIQASGDLKGIELIVVDNLGENVRSSLTELVKSGYEGAFFALLVLYFFLRHWPSTLMVSLAVPVCLTMTLGAMWALGLTLNILTMMGLLLGVGMLVDNAVVVVESIFQQREKTLGMAANTPDDPGHPTNAAITGTRLVQLAVSAGTLTSIIVFLPNVFGSSTDVGTFLFYVAVPLTISLLCSWLFSVSIIPMLATRVQPPKGITEVKIVERWKFHYERLLRWTLKKRWIMVLAMLLVLASAAIPGKFISFDFFKGAPDRTFRANWDIKGNYTLPQLEKSAREFEAFLEKNKADFDIATIYSFISQEQGMGTRIELLPESESELSPDEVKELIRKSMPKFAIGEPKFGGGGGFGGGRSGSSDEIELQITGDSSEVLGPMAQDVARYLAAKVPELKDVRSDLGNDQREIRFSIDRARAAALGFSAQQIASTIQISMRGSPLREFRTDEGEVPVWLRFKDSESISLDTLKQVRLTRPDGTSVALDAVVTLSNEPGPVAINRQNSRTSVSIRASKGKEDSLDTLRPKIDAAMREYPFPPGYGLDFGQSFEDEARAGAEMVFNLFLALVLIYMVMAALFESLMHPLAILSGVAFSIVGVLWTFLIWDTNFSVMAFIGVMILMGVVVNNGIVMIEHVNNLRAEGFARNEALVMGGKERLRPILITTAATVLGLLPLCFGTIAIGGEGPPYFPMARAIAGGLVFSTVVSLVFLPTIYLMMDDVSRWLRSFKKPKFVVQANRSQLAE